LIKSLVLIISLFSSQLIFSDIINKFETKEKIIALTFDACETKTPSYFDEKLLKIILDNKIPVTLFISGKFAKRNEERLKELSKTGFIEIENHSLNHVMNMEKLSKDQIIKEVMDEDKILHDITGEKPKYFRFPAGNYDKKTLSIVESLGYKVVHWSVVSGDPDKNMTSDKMIKGVLSQAKAGSIVIFHINRRGWHTFEALPEIIDSLKKKGFSFAKMEDCLEGK